jgi:hypothetical protein
MNLYPLFISKVLDRGEIQSERIKRISALLLQSASDSVDFRRIPSAIRTLN